MNTVKFRYPVRSYEVIDGDSVRVWLDRGWGDTKKIICRLYRIDAPELRQAKTTQERQTSIAVKLAVMRWLEKSIEGELESTSLDKGDWVKRYWGDLHRGERSLSQSLLDEEIVRPYEGKRRSWGETELKEIEVKANAMG